MALTAGIVGLPNVGKSTLFNAITKAEVLAANYPFATIDPNVGTVLVPDTRLDKLSELYKPKKTLYATCEFTDIAGLVKGASKGEGLGNQFLANIRNVDAILHVVRCFEDDNITHVEGKVDPARDANIINLELCLSDLEIIQKRIDKIAKKAQSKVDDAETEYRALKKAEEALLKEIMLRNVEFTEDEQKYIDHYCFLTAKPMMYVANIKDDSISNPEADPIYQNFKKFADESNTKVVAISANIEQELQMLEMEDRKMFLADLGVTISGLDTLIQKTYELLGYETYFTCGEQECRAWTFKKGSSAPKCAGIIHSDFERGFIRAETVSYDDLISSGNIQKAKEKGLVRQEGKDYIVKDGDIILFKFNV